MIKLFGVYVPKPLVVLGILECTVFLFCYFMAISVRFDFRSLLEIIADDRMANTASLYAVVMFSSELALGLYQGGAMARASGFLVRLMLSFLLGAAVVGLLLFLLHDYFYADRIVLVYGLAFSFLGILVSRTLFLNISSESTFKRRVLILGTGINAERIEHYCSTVSDCGFLVVGYVFLGDTINLIDENRQIAKDQSLLAIARRMAVEEIVIAVDDRRKNLPNEELLECKINRVAILDLLTFFEKELALINIELLYPSWMIFSDGFHRRLISVALKRLFDITVSLVILLFAIPFMLLVSLASLIESRGRDPILYSQVRVGLRGRPFRVYKFRSMRPDAEADGVARWATKNDSRVTPLGRFIRKTRLDELPQLYNVLNGDMSLVGQGRRGLNSSPACPATSPTMRSATG